MIYNSTWPDTKVPEGTLFDNFVGKRGDLPGKDDRLALTNTGESEQITYSQLREFSSRIAAGLLKTGLRPGDRL